MKPSAVLASVLSAVAGFIVGHITAPNETEAAVPDETETSEPAAVETEPDKSECRCGFTRTCAFGPGIVGQQQCLTTPFMVNEWTRCEPVRSSE